MLDENGGQSGGSAGVLPEGWTRGESVLSVAISLVALGFAAAHFLLPDKKVDSVTVGLVIVAAAPWLAPLLSRYVKSVKGGPSGVEVSFQEQLQQAHAAAESASLKADTALASTATTPKSGALPVAREEEGGTTGGTTGGGASPNEELRRLVEAYDQIRSRQRPSHARTTAMTAVLGQMMTTAPRVRPFDVQQALS